MPKVLIIEDDADVRAMIQQLLEREGFEVLLAGDGVEGIEVFVAGSPKITEEETP